jgi:hypothetical protein
MAFNKLNNLIEKYNLTNFLKVCIILVILYLATRVFVPDLLISNMIPAIVENFDSLVNGPIYGNELSLNEPKNTPTYFGNTCSLTLAGVYRIDTLKIKFNTNNNTSSTVQKYTLGKKLLIQFQDGNGNMRYIKTPSHTDSPPDFGSSTGTTDVVSDMSLLLSSITDETGAAIYTSKIVLTIGDSSNNISTFTDTNGNGYISQFGIYGGERNLLTLKDYNTLSTTLTNTVFTQGTIISSTSVQASNTINTYTFNNGNNTMLYSIQLNISQTSTSTSTTKFVTTDSPFNIKITYANTLYPNNNFPISKTYIVRSDSNKLIDGSTKSFIFLVDPIIANSITFSVTNVNDNDTTPVIHTLNITSILVLGKNPSAIDISDYKKNVNSALNSVSAEDQNGNICPNINELVDKQNKTQQICDNIEFQDKTKSEKLRLERNKQYLLKLQNQQDQIDQLNNVIQTLETQRENRATTSDQARVLQYQKQQGESSTVRDLVNQRLESQAHNQLYLDVKLNNTV